MKNKYFKIKASAIILAILAICYVVFVGSLMKGDQKEQKKPATFEDSRKIYFNDEVATMLLPNVFKVSSRYRLTEDVPALQADAFRLDVMQNMLESFEFKDAMPDVFVDTTLYFRVVVIMNTKRLSFDKSTADILNVSLNNQYDKLQLRYPNLEIEKLIGEMRESNIQKMMKFKHRITNSYDMSKTYQSIYWITNDLQSFVVYEFSDTQAEINDYLWSIKN